MSQSSDSLTASTTNTDTGCPFASSNNNDSNLLLDSSAANAQDNLMGSPHLRRGSAATFESASTMVGSTGSLDEKVKGLDGKKGESLESDEGLLTLSQGSMRDDREGGVSTFATCAALV